ncbi:MAG: hypothetical protein H0U76_06190 [Ktedonobacteraceae bacterium]|nr:hypothetical protein [Ktedonobacteraceae bacterium]
MKKVKKTDQPLRSHKGTIYPQPRDFVGITFAYEQRAVSVDHLQVYLARYSKRQTAQVGQITPSAVSQVIDRWKQLRWVFTAKPFASPQWVWPSKEGMQALDLQGTASAPAVGDFPRYHAATHIRFALEEQYPDTQWISERALRLQSNNKYADDDRSFIPDAVHWRKDGEEEKSYAIRVDVDILSHEEIANFLERMLDNYDFIEYYATARTLHVVKGGMGIMDLDEEDEGRITIRKVEDVGSYKLIG